MSTSLHRIGAAAHLGICIPSRLINQHGKACSLLVKSSSRCGPLRRGISHYKITPTHFNISLCLQSTLDTTQTCNRRYISLEQSTNVPRLDPKRLGLLPKEHGPPNNPDMTPNRPFILRWRYLPSAVISERRKCV